MSPLRAAMRGCEMSAWPEARAVAAHASRRQGVRRSLALLSSLAGTKLRCVLHPHLRESDSATSRPRRSQSHISTHAASSQQAQASKVAGSCERFRLWLARALPPRARARWNGRRRQCPCNAGSSRYLARRLGSRPELEFAPTLKGIGALRATTISRRTFQTAGGRGSASHVHVMRQRLLWMSATRKRTTAGRSP